MKDHIDLGRKLSGKPKLSILHKENVHINPFELNGKETFPLYVHITINRNNTQMASAFNQQLRVKAGHLGSIDSPLAEQIIREEVRVYTDIVSFEERRTGNPFDVRTLSKLYRVLARPIHTVFNNYLLPRLRNLVLACPQTKELHYILKLDYQSDDFFSPPVTTDLFMYVLLKTVPEFKALVAPYDLFGLLQDMDAYDKFCVFCPPKDCIGRYPTPRLIDWMSGSLVSQYTDYLRNQLTDGDQAIAYLSIADKMLKQVF